MIDKEKAKAAIASMCENPEWKKVIENAPGAANIRIALAFYASKNLAEMTQQEKDEYREFREMLERQLNAEELKYLAEEFSRMGVEAAATHYNELFAKKTPEEQQQGQKAFDDLMAKIRAGGSGGDADKDNGEEDEEDWDSEDSEDWDSSEEDEGEEGDEAAEDETPVPTAQPAQPVAPAPAQPQATTAPAPAQQAAAPAPSAPQPPVQSPSPAPAQQPQQEELPFTVPQSIIEKNKEDEKRIAANGANLFAHGFKFKKRGADSAPAKDAQSEQKSQEAKE